MSDRIKHHHASFKRRLGRMYRTPEAIEAMNAIVAAKQTMLCLYKNACLEHWKQHGNSASTGWGETPEGLYQESHRPEDSAQRLAFMLWESLAACPEEPPR